MNRLFAIFIALLLPLGAVEAQKKETYKVRTVVIDPGHGGAKPGAHGSRSQEKNITLAVAKKFGQLVEDNYPDVRVIYTRTTDVDISLAERANIANHNKADLFISIHANSHPTNAPTGVETFVMGLSESKANLEVAMKENADILLEADYKSNSAYGGFDPNSPESYVIFSMHQNAFIDKSLNFAQNIQNQYRQNLRTINRGVKQAELFVLYKTSMPSVLTEIGFISNPTEEAFMLSEEGQAKIAICLFNAFMNFKATEEGSKRIAEPVINIKGYTPPAATATLAENTQKTSIKTEQPEKTESTTEKPEPKSEKRETSIATEASATPQPAANTPQTEEPKKTIEEHAATQPETTAQALEEPKKAEEEPPTKPKETPKPAPKPEEKPTPSVSMLQVKEVQQNDATPKETSQQPTAQPQPTVQKAPKPTLQKPKNTASETDPSYYTVQFLTMGIRYNPGAPELEGISDINIVQQGKLYAYTTGRFKTKQEAAKYCEHLKQATSFSDAWYYLYKKPSAQPAASQQAPTPNQPSTPAVKKADKGIRYHVQFSTTDKALKPGDRDLQGISDIHSSRSGNYYVYYAGEYTNLQDAQKRCENIKQTTTFKDAFVIATHNGTRISLKEARTIEKGE